MRHALFALLIVGPEQTMNVGLRDHSVIEDVRITPGTLPRATLEILGIRVGRDRLRDARARLGAAPLLDQGRSHDALGVCYVAPLEDATLVVETGTLEQDPTDTDIVDTLVVVRGAAARCGRLPSGRLSTRSGLRLGIAAGAVEAQLGAPGKRTDVLLLYVFVQGATTAVVEVHLEQGVVAQLVITEWRDSGE